MAVVFKISVIILIITPLLYIWRKELTTLFYGKGRKIASNLSEIEHNDQKSYNLNRVSIDYSKKVEVVEETEDTVTEDKGDIPKGLKFKQLFDELNNKNS